MLLARIENKISKRKIQIVLGLLWILDGLLQLQHRMFTPAFANTVIAPAGQDQSSFVSWLVSFAVHIILINPVIFNLLFVLIQLSIGALILFKRTTVYGLVGSFMWGLGVWIFGEGLGGLTTGHTLLLLGTPGAALLYSIISLGIISRNDSTTHNTKPAYWLTLVWAVLWLGGSLLQLGSGQNTTLEMSNIVSYMSTGSPGWMASLDLRISSLIHGWGSWFILLLVAIQLLIGVLVLFHRHIRTIAITSGIIVSIVFWIVGQNLGGYYTGTATDPNTAPLIILLGVAILGTDDDLFSNILG